MRRPGSTRWSGKLIGRIVCTPWELKESSEPRRMSPVRSRYIVRCWSGKADQQDVKHSVVDSVQNTQGNWAAWLASRVQKERENATKSTRCAVHTFMQQESSAEVASLSVVHPIRCTHRASTLDIRNGSSTNSLQGCLVQVCCCDIMY